MWIKKYWPAVVGGAVQLPGLWSFLKWLLDWRGRIDALAETYHEIGGWHAMVGYILDPPPWFSPLALVVGLLLIWWSIRRSHKQVDSKPVEKTKVDAALKPLPKLEDLFKTDFGFLSVDRSVTIKVRIPTLSFEKNVEVPLKIWRDFSSNSEFVSVFVPLFGDARMDRSIEGVIEHLKADIRQWREEAKLIGVVTGFPGSLSRSEDLVFSGRVFVYTLNPLDAIEIGRLTESYRKDGMFLEIRGSQHLFHHFPR